MNRGRCILVAVLIATTVGTVVAQRQQATPSLEQRVATLELQVEELIDMHLDVMKIRPGKTYERDVKRRMETFQRNINTVDMKVRK